MAELHHNKLAHGGRVLVIYAPNKESLPNIDEHMKINNKII